MIKRIFLSVFVCAAAVMAAAVAVPQKTITPALVCTPVTEQKTEQIQFAVMQYTPDEAESVLARLQQEKKAAEEAKKAAEAKKTQRAEHKTSYASGEYSAQYFRRMGVVYSDGWRWTWYSERVLPGGGLHIPGRHTDGDGYVRDGDGYICLASDALAWGTVIRTPFGGYGRVYDCGCGWETIDVYVGW